MILILTMKHSSHRLHYDDGNISRSTDIELVAVDYGHWTGCSWLRTLNWLLLTTVIELVAVDYGHWTGCCWLRALNWLLLTTGIELVAVDYGHWTGSCWNLIIYSSLQRDLLLWRRKCSLIESVIWSVYKGRYFQLSSHFSLFLLRNRWHSWESRQ